MTESLQLLHTGRIVAPFERDRWHSGHQIMAESGAEKANAWLIRVLKCCRVLTVSDAETLEDVSIPSPIPH
jgi:hypothetical protein